MKVNVFAAQVHVICRAPICWEQKSETSQELSPALLIEDHYEHDCSSQLSYTRELH